MYNYVCVSLVQHVSVQSAVYPPPPLVLLGSCGRWLEILGLYLVQFCLECVHGLVEGAQVMSEQVHCVVIRSGLPNGFLEVHLPHFVLREDRVLAQVEMLQDHLVGVCVCAEAWTLWLHNPCADRRISALPTYLWLLFCIIIWPPPGFETSGSTIDE